MGVDGRSGDGLMADFFLVEFTILQRTDMRATRATALGLACLGRLLLILPDAPPRDSNQGSQPELPFRNIFALILLKYLGTYLPMLGNNATLQVGRMHAQTIVPHDEPSNACD